MTSIANELSAISVRTHRMMYVSAVVHALLLAWLILHQTVVAQTEGLTEITFLEVTEPPPAPVAPKETRKAPRQEVTTEKALNEKPPEQFERQLVRSQVEPVPQKKSSIEDVLSSRLSSLQKSAKSNETKISQLMPTPNVSRPSMAGVDVDQPRQASPTELERDANGRPAPADLPRMKVPKVQSAALAPNIMPDTDDSPRAALDYSSSSRSLAGAQLIGQVADRGLLTQVKPTYPEWAKQEGVEASVTIYFLVLPDGRVKENVLVDRTSGFGDFDESAVNAILKWRFEAVSGTREQWGKITFNFRLTDGS